MAKQVADNGRYVGVGDAYSHGSSGSMSMFRVLAAGRCR